MVQWNRLLAGDYALFTRRDVQCLLAVIDGSTHIVLSIDIDRIEACLASRSQAVGSHIGRELIVPCWVALQCEGLDSFRRLLRQSAVIHCPRATLGRPPQHMTVPFVPARSILYGIKTHCRRRGHQSYCSSAAVSYHGITVNGQVEFVEHHVQTIHVLVHGQRVPGLGIVGHQRVVFQEAELGGQGLLSRGDSSLQAVGQSPLPFTSYLHAHPVLFILIVGIGTSPVVAALQAQRHLEAVVCLGRFPQQQLAALGSRWHHHLIDHLPFRSAQETERIVQRIVEIVDHGGLCRCRMVACRPFHC